MKNGSEKFLRGGFAGRGPGRLLAGILGVVLSAGLTARGQQILPGPLSETPPPNPLLNSTVQPGTAFLFDLERKFAAAVAQRGGAGFASFFDKDGITLANRQPPVIGQAAIAAHATWSPNDYQLTWTPEGGELSADGTMGYTWGHYEGWSLKNPTIERGRYVTVWKKEKEGSWKVVMDTSNEDPPQPECKCTADAKPNPK